MVGQSSGGMNVRVYASQHPQDVVGMVEAVELLQVCHLGRPGPLDIDPGQRAVLDGLNVESLLQVGAGSIASTCRLPILAGRERPRLTLPFTGYQAMPVRT